jgi:broad specificity phosphatase PhoE
MTTTVWLARHGEVHNPRNVLYGRLPRMRLTKLGRDQARSLATVLAGQSVVSVYSSPLLRARSTASIIAAGMPTVDRVHLDADLQEVRSGWQGEAVEVLEAIHWDLYGHPRTPADETLQMIARRMRRWLDRVLRRHAGNHVVGVSHGDPILVLIGMLRGLPLAPAALFPRPYIGTGVIFRCQFDQAGGCQNIELIDRLPPPVPAIEIAA